MSVCQQLDPALEPACELLEACRSLYAGSWDDMAEDIRRRQAGRPYLFRVDCEPGRALTWIDRFRAYDRARGERLIDAMPSEDER